MVQSNGFRSSTYRSDLSDDTPADQRITCTFSDTIDSLETRWSFLALLLERLQKWSSLCVGVTNVLQLSLHQKEQQTRIHRQWQHGWSTDSTVTLHLSFRLLSCLRSSCSWSSDCFSSQLYSSRFLYHPISNKRDYSWVLSIETSLSIKIVRRWDTDHLANIQTMSLRSIPKAVSTWQWQSIWFLPDMFWFRALLTTRSLI
jgi:hypothetical protein